MDCGAVCANLFRMLYGFHEVFQSLPDQLLGGCVIAGAMSMSSGLMCVGRLGVEFR